jgi:hypothetical protein
MTVESIESLLKQSQMKATAELEETTMGATGVEATTTLDNGGSATDKNDSSSSSTSPTTAIVSNNDCDNTNNDDLDVASPAKSPTRAGEEDDAVGTVGLELLYDFEPSSNDSAPLTTSTANNVNRSSNNPSSKSAVHPRRKEQLLLQARADRLQWIQQVPLPFRLPTPNSNTNGRKGLYHCSDDTSAALPRTFSSSRLAAFLLPTAMPLLEHLYDSLVATTTSGTTTAAVEERIESLLLEQQEEKSRNAANDPSFTTASSSIGSGGGSSPDNSSSSTTPHQEDVIPAYRDFLERLQDPACAMLVASTRHVCTTAASTTGGESSSRAAPFKSYLASTLTVVLSHGAWKQQRDHQQQQQQELLVRRSLESFIYGQCYFGYASQLGRSSSSSPPPPQHLWNDSNDAKAKEIAWQERLASLQFVTPRHLELSCFLHDTNNGDDDGVCSVRRLLADAMHAVHSIDLFFSPFEKLEAIRYVYHAVNAALSRAMNPTTHNRPNSKNDCMDTSSSVVATTAKVKLPSADDVLPCLILVLLQARPERLLQNLQFVEEYSPLEYLRGEAGYAYTNLQGAVHFLQELKTADSLANITPEEFRNALQTCRAAAAEQVQKQQKQVVTNSEATAEHDLAPSDDGVAATIRIPPVEVRAARMRGEIVDLEWARQWYQQQQTLPPEQAMAETTACVNGQSSHKVTTTAIKSAFDEAAEGLPEGYRREYTFLTSSPEDIRMSDLPQLLAEYRMLVHATESLIGDRAAKISAARKQKAAKAKKDLFDRVRQVDPTLLPPTNGSPWKKNT